MYGAMLNFTFLRFYMVFVCYGMLFLCYAVRNGMLFLCYALRNSKIIWYGMVSYGIVCCAVLWDLSWYFFFHRKVPFILHFWTLIYRFFSIKTHFQFLIILHIECLYILLDNKYNFLILLYLQKNGLHDFWK